MSTTDYEEDSTIDEEDFTTEEEDFNNLPFECPKCGSMFSNFYEANYDSCKNSSCMLNSCIGCKMICDDCNKECCIRCTKYTNCCEVVTCCNIDWCSYCSDDICLKCDKMTEICAKCSESFCQKCKDKNHEIYNYCDDCGYDFCLICNQNVLSLMEYTEEEESGEERELIIKNPCIDCYDMIEEILIEKVPDEMIRKICEYIGFE